MINEFESMTKNGKEKKWITLVTPLLFELSKQIELLNVSFNMKTKIFHDELFSYDKVFNHLESLTFKDSIPIVINLGDRIIQSNFPNMKTIKMKNSKEEIMIQAADLLCGFVNKTFLDLDNSKELNEDIKKIWYALFAIRDNFIEAGILPWNTYANENLIYDLMSALMGNKHNIPKKYYNIIINDFPKTIKI